MGLQNEWSPDGAWQRLEARLLERGPGRSRVGGGQVHAQQTRVPFKVRLWHKVQPCALVDAPKGDPGGGAQSARGEVCPHIADSLAQLGPAGGAGHVNQGHGDQRPQSLVHPFWKK